MMGGDQILESGERSDAETEWVTSIARNNPHIFGKKGMWEISAVEEPQVSSHNTRLYMVDGTGVHIKFFKKTLGRINPTYTPCREMESEHKMLKEYESRGFSTGKHRVVVPLGTNSDLDCALATVYVGGKPLLSIIQEVIGQGRNPGDLYIGLDLAAGLLKKIHTVMPGTPRIDNSETFFSCLKSILYLEEQDSLGGYHRRIMKGLTRWYNYKPLYDQAGVTIHGDANPSNFKIDSGVIYAFDVERSRPRRSPVYDLGTMAAELKHQFTYMGHSGARSEPYIEHFLRSYCSDEEEFSMVTALLPFYMSQSLFRIAMLGYWKGNHKRYLIEEGTRCMEVRPE